MTGFARGLRPAQRDYGWPAASRTDRRSGRIALRSLGEEEQRLISVCASEECPA